MLVALVSVSIATLAWAGMRVQVADALDRLRGQGVSIVYSSALAPADVYIDVDSMTLSAVRDALPTVGLRLDQRDGNWLLVKGPTVAAAAHPADATDEKPADGSRIETIIVTGTRHRFAAIGADSATLLPSEELDRVPALGGDSIRSVNLLPGMSSMGVSVKPRIRGGLEDEQLVLLDGVEILDPYHFANYQNLFSAIDGRVIDGVDVYSGGFPSRYGGRMSGVMEIDTLAQRERPAAELGLSMYSAFANARSTEPDADTTWLASARYGASDQLLQRLGLQSGRPYFSDAMARVGHTFNADAKLYFGGFATDEDISLNDDAQRATWKSNSSYLWSRFDGVIDDRVNSSTVLSYMSSRNEMHGTSPASESATVAGFLDDSRDTERVALRSSFAVATEQARQEFGVQADWTRTNYDSSSLIDRGAFGVLFDGRSASQHDIEETLEGVTGGLYWSADFPVGTTVSLQPGLRWDFQTAQGYAAQVSPRLGIKWLPVEDLTLRFDAGRYYQPDGVNEMDTADGVARLYKPQRADHYIASAMWRANADTQVRLDAYEKQYGRTTTRFENVFDPFVILPQVAVDRVQIDSTRARTHGVDFELQETLTDQTSLIARYSYMDADDYVVGQWVPRRWSQRQTVTGIAMWKSDAYSASAALTWHSGWRTTAPPPSVPVGTTIPIEDVLNNRHLNDYFSVDLNASASHPVWRSTVTLFADITNTLDRQNPTGIDYAAVEGTTTTQFVPEHTSLLPIVPWVGVVVAF